MEPKKILIGIKSKMSEGMVIGLLSKLHLHINAFTVAPTGVKVPVNDCDAVPTVPKVPVAKPRRVEIEPDASKVTQGVYDTVGSPLPAVLDQ